MLDILEVASIYDIGSGTKNIAKTITLSADTNPTKMCPKG